MLRGMFGKIDDLRRLRWLLALLFTALALPTGAVLWQAYGQLKWEAFHQHRGQAEALTVRINGVITEGMANAESRSFAEYSFLNITGDSDGGFLLRSPLSNYPVAEDLPGLIGYFQIDSEGKYSTPLLPDSGANVGTLGISESEFRERDLLSERIRGILEGNRLMEDKDTAGGPETQEFFDQLTQGSREKVQRGAELREQSNQPAPLQSRGNASSSPSTH